MMVNTINNVFPALSRREEGSPPANNNPFDNYPEPNPFAAQGTDSYALRQRVSLDGEWTFQFGSETPGKIQVPGAWESQRADLQQRAGSAIYERSFTLPADYEDQRVVLHFGAVDYYTEVWVNGVPVGVHEGGYTAFEFDIAHALNGYGPDKIQSVLVRVTDVTVEQDTLLPNGEPLTFAEIPHGKQSWYTSVSGIWQSVWMEAPSAYQPGPPQHHDRYRRRQSASVRAGRGPP